MLTIKKLSAMPYAQAHVEIDDENGGIVLFSYNTLVASISHDGWCQCFGLYSQTTRKHISAFVKEYAPNLNYYDFKQMYTGGYMLNYHTGEVIIFNEMEENND